MTGVSNGALAPKVSKVFTWNGDLSDGSIATSGTYYFRIVLHDEDRSINLSPPAGWPIQVLTQPRTPRVVNVRLVGTGAKGTATGTTTTGTVSTSASSTTSSTGTTGTGTATTSTGPALLSPPHGAVKVVFQRGRYRRAWVDIYRTDVSGKPHRVWRVKVRNLTHNWIFWTERSTIIRRRRAPIWPGLPLRTLPAIRPRGRL